MPQNLDNLGPKEHYFTFPRQGEISPVNNPEILLKKASNDQVATESLIQQIENLKIKEDEKKPRHTYNFLINRK